MRSSTLLCRKQASIPRHSENLLLITTHHSGQGRLKSLRQQNQDQREYSESNKISLLHTIAQFHCLLSPTITLTHDLSGALQSEIPLLMTVLSSTNCPYGRSFSPAFLGKGAQILKQGRGNHCICVECSDLAYEKIISSETPQISSEDESYYQSFFF